MCQFIQSNVWSATWSGFNFITWKSRFVFSQTQGLKGFCNPQIVIVRISFHLNFSFNTKEKQTNEEIVDCLVSSFSGEFMDLDKIYRVTLAQSNNEDFLLDLWDPLLNGTIKYIRKRDPNEAEYHLISFMHNGIDFLDQCNIIEHKFIYGLIFSFIATQDKRLQLVDLVSKTKYSRHFHFPF